MTISCKHTHENTPWSITENAINKMPTVSDIKETKALLYDFCIITTIPSFSTLAQLLKWRYKLIDEKLSS